MGQPVLSALRGGRRLGHSLLSSTSSMEAHAPPDSTSHDALNLFQQLDDYPWGTDQEFQFALKAILGNNTSPEQVRDLTLRARCYYFSRKKQIHVDFNAYKVWVAEHPESTVAETAEAELSSAGTGEDDGERGAAYPATFAQIVEMITTGQSVPGIKEIPPTVLTGQATKAAASKRRKPWETVDVEASDAPGTFGDRRDEYISQEEP